MLFLKITVDVNATSGFLDYFNSIIGSVTAFVAIVVAIAGYLKYRQTKNREIYEKVLTTVYAPLYIALVKQETFRKSAVFMNPLIDSFEMVPIISIYENEKIIFGRDDILKITDEINTGLASPKLLELLSSYTTVCYFENKLQHTFDEYVDYIQQGNNHENFAKKNEVETYMSFTISKVKIERELYAEILRGYQYYNEKLDLEKESSINSGKFHSKNHASVDEIKNFTREIGDKNSMNTM